MRSFLIACATAIVLALGAGGVLSLVQKPADQAFHTNSVRLPAGHGT